MNIVDIVIVAVILAAVLLAVRHIRRMKKNGGCGCGCSGCTRSAPCDSTES